MCCHPQASDCRSTPKHGKVIFLIEKWGKHVTKVSLNSGKYSTIVEFHVFEIHTLNDDLRLLKSIPFFPRFHEIDIKAVRADHDDV